MPGIDINTKFISHFNGNNGAKEIVDSGNTGYVSTQVATAQLDPLTKQFGNTSLLLDGNSDYLSIPDSSDWILGGGTGDFTIDCFVKSQVPTISTNTVINQLDTTEASWILRISGSNILDFALFDGQTGAIHTTVFISSNVAITNNVWTHIAIIRSGNDLGMYINGTQVAYDDITGISVVDVIQPLRIGGRFSAGSFANSFNGNIDEVRITHDNAFGSSPNVGLTDTITVPTAEHTSDANTKLLLHMNSHDISGDGGSNSYHIPTFIGTAQIDTALKQFGNGALLLDGNSDYITMPDSPDWQLGGGLGDFTIDCWINPKATTAPFFTNPIVTQLDNVTANFIFRHTQNDELNFQSFAGTTAGGSIIAISTPPSSITLNIWQHVAVIRSGNNLGIYINGIQEAYQDITGISFVDVAEVLRIGATMQTFVDPIAPITFFNGSIDEMRITHANSFVASPNVGLTNTITVPTAEYSVGIPPPTPDEEIRFNSTLGRQENVNPQATLSFDKFSGEHYKNYKKE